MAYQSQVRGFNCYNISNCGFTFPAVPTGHRVVVQHIGGTDGFLGQATFVQATVYFSTHPVAQKIEAFFPSFMGNSSYGFDQPVLIYVDSGLSLEVVVHTDASFDAKGIMTLTGYELDCAVAACAPIATQ